MANNCGPNCECKGGDPSEDKGPPNENCLEGIACPRCGNREPFYIQCVGTEKVYDDGSEDTYDSDWTDDSQITCGECQHTGTVATFRMNEDGSPFSCGHQDIGYCAGDHCCEVEERDPCQSLTLVLGADEVHALERILDNLPVFRGNDRALVYDRLSAAYADREARVA